MSIFPTRLKECRERKKSENPIWTQGYIAEKIGVARVTYTAYENGTKQPPLDTVNRIADILGASTDYLLGRVDNPKSSISIAFSHGGEELSPDEEEHLNIELKRFRELKERFMKEKNKEQ